MMPRIRKGLEREGAPALLFFVPDPRFNIDVDLCSEELHF